MGAPTFNPVSLAKKGSLIDAVGLLWLGRKLAAKERKLFTEMMILCLDHGPDSPSAQATIKAAKKHDMLRSVEAGIHEINASHGGAIEGLAEILQHDIRDEADIVAESLKTGKRLPGFGHRIYKDKDPRAVYLLKRAKELGYSGKIVVRAKRMEKALAEQKGKKLPLNIDGAMAVVLSELKVEPGVVNAFFLWPRVAGLVHQYVQADGK